MKIELENEDVFMNPTYVEFCLAVVSRLRNGTETTKQIEYRAVEIKANGMEVRVPCQLFIDGKFVDAENGYAIPTVNPADESVICEVQCASPKDVDKAVRAAKKAFEQGEWSKISARERGQMLFRCESPATRRRWVCIYFVFVFYPQTGRFDAATQRRAGYDRIARFGSGLYVSIENARRYEHRNVEILRRLDG